MIKLRDLLVAAAVAGAVAALAVPSFADPPEDYGPPADRVEMVPPPPGPTATWVWRHGHWAWNGMQYVWVRGEYVERIHPGAIWVSGHWAVRPDGYVWIEGHWR